MAVQAVTEALKAPNETAKADRHWRNNVTEKVFGRDKKP